MSKSSSNITSFIQKNKTKDIQGGEKKVMKKSLSVVLSTAMALSMFSSLAFAAKSSADFTDLKDLDAATKAKFDAMISAGIFDGVSETTFGLKDEMNRAQFAKVAALITGIEVNKDLKTSSFSDVKVDDAANGYALPYIEALKTAGITDGYAEGEYNPAGKVTKEQLATFLVRVLGKDADAKGKTGTDTTVTDWAQGYVALALELKLLPAGEAGKFGGQSNATRDLLLTGAYEAKAQYVSPGKVSVTSAKASGAKSVTVTFNKPVDTDKAKLALKKGTSDVVATTKFADDKKSAVLTLTDTKVTKGDYTVTLSGLDEAGVDKTTATFTGEDEVLTKIDFVTAGDTVAYADKVIIKAKAVNQYGEAASTNAGSYDVYTSAATFTKITKDEVDGTLLITLDTKVDGQTTQGVSVIPVTIVNNDSHLTATKNFKLGTAPILSKLELGTAVYSNGGTALKGKGENVTFNLNLFDQYGGTISFETLENDMDTDTQLIWNDYIAATDVDYDVEDNGNDVPRVKISLTKDIDKSGDYNFTVFNQAATATGKITIQSAKIATKIQIGDLNDVLAAGDTDVYIPIVAYDAAGNTLSADDLASDENVDRIKVTVSGASSPNAIEKSGEHKGTVKLTEVGPNTNGAVSVTAIIASANVSSTATKTYTIQDARIPDHFKEVTDPAKYAVKGGTAAVEFAVLDQYGKVLDDSHRVNSNGDVSASGSEYTVTVTADTYAKNGTTKINRVNLKLPTPAMTLDNGNSYEFGVGKDYDFGKFNDELTLQSLSTAEAGDNVKVTVAIKKDGKEVSKKTKTLTVVDGATDLTYSVNSVATLFNTLDNDATNDTVTSHTYGSGAGEVLVPASVMTAEKSSLSREVKISAKNNAGEAVKLPKEITSITSSNTNVATVALGTVAAGNAGKAYVIGNQAGTATLNVTFKTAKGEIKNATIPVTVKADAITVDKLTTENDEVTVAANANLYKTIDILATDNYGVEYEDIEAGQYNFLLGLTFSVTNLKGATSVDINQYGEITGVNGTTVGTDVTFDLTVNATSGKTAVTPIRINY